MADPDEVTEEEPVDGDMWGGPWEALPSDAQPGYDPENPNAVEWDFSGVSVEGDPLKTHDAIKALRKRLPYSSTFSRIYSNMTGDGSNGYFQPNAQAIVAEVTRKILSYIPEEMWTKDFLANVDVRPLLQQVMQSPAQVQDPDATSEIEGVQWTSQERAYAAIMLTDESSKIEDRIFKSVMVGAPEAAQNDRTHPAYIEAQNIAATMASEWRDGKGAATVPTPAAAGETYFDPESGQFKTTPTASGELPENVSDVGAMLGLDDLGADVLTPTRFMSRQDLQRLVRSGELGIDQLGQFETDPAEMRPFVDGEVPEVSGRGHIMYSGEFGESQMTGGGGPMMNQLLGRDADYNPHAGNMVEDTRDWYTVRDILNKPAEMDRAELMEVHEKLKKAGLYDLVGGEPVIPGDSTDPHFKAAWKMLASMSLEKGQPMTSILEERTVAYQQELESSLSVMLTDPARLRINADMYAQTAIGRKLNEEESEELVTFLHDLERKNARIQAGLDINSGESDPIEGVDALDEGTTADIDARMKEWMEASPEAGARDIAETYDSFTRLLSGPGRGVGV